MYIRKILLTSVINSAPVRDNDNYADFYLMFVYLSIFFIVGFFSILLPNRGVSWLLLILFAAFLLLFAGTRYYVGCDYVGYLLRFERAPLDFSLSNLIGREEAGFNGILGFLKFSGYSYSSLLMICSAIYVLCLCRFASLFRSPAIFLVLAFPVLMVQLGMSGIRQALALGFLVVSLTSFVNSSRVWTAIWILVAAQFHTSAVVFLPMSLMAGRHLSTRRLIAAMVILGPAVLFLLQERLDVYSDRYIEQIYGENSASGAWLRYALVSLPFLFFVFWHREIKVLVPKLYELLRLFMMITFLMLPVGLISSVALHRLVFYVMPVSILALCYVSQVAAMKFRVRPIAHLVPLGVYGSYIVVWFAFSSKASSCYVPYQTWLLQ